MSDGPFHTRELQRRVDEFDERLTLLETQMKLLATPSTPIASTEPVKPANTDTSAGATAAGDTGAAQQAAPTTTDPAPTATAPEAAGNTETVGESRIGAAKPE